MVTISNSTIRANIFETIYDSLSAGLASTDFVATVSAAPTVTAAYIDGDQDAFPQVVVQPVEIDKAAGTFSKTADVSPKTARVIITVYTTGPGSNKDRDLIGDKIDNIISTTKYPGITLVDSSDNTATTTLGGNKIRARTMSYSYRRL